ncbi:MAG: hypothetical protein HY316_03360 [Acidobacteria bacterium]|nr:hypothetical protein [Acidobacteriota bacterium]
MSLRPGYFTGIEPALSLKLSKVSIPVSSLLTDKLRLVARTDVAGKGVRLVWSWQRRELLS